MLNRTTPLRGAQAAVSTPLPRVAPGASPRRFAPGAGVHNRLLAGPNAWLFQLVLIAAIVSTFACAYLWQTNAITDIESDTLSIQQKTANLERSNTDLMVQLAKWNHPAHIEQKAREQGMAPAQPALVMQVPTVPQSTGLRRLGD